MRVLSLVLSIGVLAASTAETRPSPAGSPPRVIVVLSHDADPYQQAFATLRRDLLAAIPGATVDVVLLRGDTARVGAALDSIRSGAPALVVTLGTLATRAIVAQVHDVPVVAGMILNADELGGAPNATAVYLEYPLELELAWIRRLLPDARRVGVIYHGAGRVAEARRAAAAAGLQLQAIHVDDPAGLPDALAALRNRADVLWSLPDPVVYNPETARSVLLFALRNRIPLVGQSAAWVRAGALYALDRDYGDVGAQCAELAARVLGGEAVGTIAPVAPRTIRYVVNRRTAGELRLTLSERTLREAAEVVN